MISRRYLLLAATCLWLVLMAAVVAAPVEAEAASLSAPGAPRATRITSRTATVRWNPAAGATSYEVLRGAVVVARVGPGVRSFTDTTLAPARWYAYRIAARSSAGVRRTDIVPVVTTAAGACTHWVSSSGNDRGDGSSGDPWRTVSRLTRAWQPGWVGCLRGSFTEDVSIRSGGTAAAPVTLRSEPGSRALLTGRLWIADGADHVVVSGLSLDGRALAGVTAGDLPSPTVNGDHAVFLGNDVYNQRTRICFDIGSIRGWGTATGTVLARNRVHDCGERLASGDGNNHHHGIYVESGRATRIVQNVVYGNADRGIQLYPDAQGTWMLGNVIDGNGEGIIFSGAEGYASSGNRAIGNVVTNSRTRYDVEYWWQDPRRVGTGNVVARNCVGGGREGAIDLPAVGYAVGSNVLARPSFVDRLAGDLRPRAGSACRALLTAPGLPLAPFRP